MSTAMEEARRLRELAERYERQAEKLDKLEPVALRLSELGDGSVVAFEKQFRGMQTVYSYAAIKVKGAWYLSGTRSSSKTDAQLAEFLGSQYDEGRLWSPDTLEVLRSTPYVEKLCPRCGSDDVNRTAPWYYKAHGRSCADAFHDEADGEE